MNFTVQILNGFERSVRGKIQSREFNPHQNLISIFTIRAVALGGGLMSELLKRLWVKGPFYCTAESY